MPNQNFTGVLLEFKAKFPHFFSLYLTFLLCLGFAQPSHSQNISMDMGAAISSEPADLEKHIQASLIAEPQEIVLGKSFWVGLHLKLEPQWHVYWKNPGDAGLPVSLAWTLPEGFTAGSIQWPYPKKIFVPPLMNFGYSGEVLFPIEIHAPKSFSNPANIVIKAKARWIVCREICLPGGQELSLSVPLIKSSGVDSQPQPDPKNSTLFKSARFNLPVAPSTWTFSAQISDSSLLLIAKNPYQENAHLLPFSFFPEASGVLENAATQKYYAVSGGYALEIPRVPAPGADPLANQGPDSLFGIAVSESAWGIAGAQPALQIRIPVERGKPIPPALTKPILLKGESLTLSPSESFSFPDPKNDTKHTIGNSKSTSFFQLVLILGAAFLGGLILNLMPCVLPVLSLKIFDFVKRAGQSRWKIFSHGLTFSSGVLISFWILAGILLVLRSGGQHLGWGFQLQSPGFILILCSLFFLFSLNLFGVFELGTLFTRIGSPQDQGGHGGSFFAGVTATVVATPCTAPFMGSAMGYAFSQPAYYAMLVFTFLGLGMAAPYLLLSGFPGLLRFLPKPGAWMENLKQFMGFPLLGTSIWLAWVLGHQVGVDALIALLLVLLLASISAWILGKWSTLHQPQLIRILAWILAGIIFVPAFIFAVLSMDQFGTLKRASATDSNPSSSIHEGDIPWETFSETRLAELIAEGKPVFIDFTADWCLSCKVNEKVALGSQEVLEKLNHSGLALLKADWTLRDENLAKSLAKYGRNSIPLYVLYQGGGPEDYVILPEVLTPGIVLEALQRVEMPGHKKSGTI